MTVLCWRDEESHASLKVLVVVYWMGFFSASWRGNQGWGEQGIGDSNRGKVARKEGRIHQDGQKGATDGGEDWKKGTRRDSNSQQPIAGRWRKLGDGILRT